MMKKPFLPLNATYSLQETQIDIHAFHLNTPLPKRARAYLSAEERNRAERFHFDHHRAYFTRARCLLRLILSKYLDIAPENLIFDYGKQGKPFLPEYPNLMFNLSHSGIYALLAIGETYPVGIDIERFSQRPYLGIGQHVFSTNENQLLNALPKYLKPFMFFNTWAQKEAFIKLLGLGLTYPTAQLTVQSLASTSYELLDPIYKTHCILSPFMPYIGYAAALCCNPKIKTIHYEVSLL